MKSKQQSILLLLCCLLFSLMSFQLSLAEESPEAAARAVEQLNATLLQCMQKGPQLGFSGRYALLEPVMKKYFFYSLMVKKSTGSWWRQMTASQQKELLDKYITWSISTYANRFASYRGQRFVVAAARPVHRKYMQVVVHIIKPDRRKRVLEYLLAMDQEKKLWRIVDVRVKGVSQLALTRAQFKSILQKQGIEGLLALLDKKIQKVTPAGHDPSLTHQ